MHTSKSHHKDSLPKGWERRKLGEIGNIMSGATPAVNVSKYWEGEIPWLTPRDLSGYNKIYIAKGKRNITVEGMRRSSINLLPKGTVLLTSRAPIGYVAIAENAITTNQGFKNLVPNKKIAHSIFLYYALKRKTKHLEKVSIGSTFLEITGKILKKFKLAIPKSLSEQTAITQVLSDTDALIQAIQQLIDKKQALKTATMQQLLTGKTRLPEFSKGSEDNNATNLPKGWGIRKVIKLGNIVTGSTPKTRKKEYWGGSILWVTPTDITASKYIFETERTLTHLGLDKTRSLPPNSLLVTCIASIGKNAILKSPGACNQQINAIIPNKKNNTEFLYHLIENNKKYLTSKAGLTATSIISKRCFENIFFSIPTHISEQAAIAQVFSDMDEEIQALYKQKEKYQRLKKGMMQQLLTGKIRLV